MNKNGGIGFAILMSIGIFVVGFTMLNFLLPEVSDLRVNLNCDSPDTIHDGNKLLCLALVDLTVPYWILLILSIGLGAITSRLIF